MRVISSPISRSIIDPMEASASFQVEGLKGEDLSSAEGEGVAWSVPPPVDRRSGFQSASGATDLQSAPVPGRAWRIR